MGDTTTDPIAAWLTDTRNGTRAIRWPDDVDHLLAAIEGVLEVTDPLKNPNLGGMFMAALHLQVREAISRELLGEGESDAH